MKDVTSLLSDRSGKTMTHLINNADSSTIDSLLKLGLSDEDKSWRALWVLEKILAHNHQFLTHSFLDKISDAFLKQEKSSQLRHLLKVMLMYENENFSGAVVDKSFSIITSVRYDAAVRVHAMQLVYEMTLIYSEFSQELKPILEEIIKMETKPSLLARAKKINKKLQK